MTSCLSQDPVDIVERWKDAHTSLDLELLDKPIGRALGWRVIESHQTYLFLSVCSLAWLGVSGIVGSSPLHIQGSQVADFASFFALPGSGSSMPGPAALGFAVLPELCLT